MQHMVSCHMYSGYREKLEYEAGFNLEVQSQLELSFSPAAAPLILMNVCFVDYFCSISCYLSWISGSLLSGFKLSYLWVATQMKSRKAWVKLQKFSIATVHPSPPLPHTISVSGAFLGGPSRRFVRKGLLRSSLPMF